MVSLVVDADGNTIPGLYAAFEVAGGVLDNNRIGGKALVQRRTCTQVVAACTWVVFEQTLWKRLPSISPRKIIGL